MNQSRDKILSASRRTDIPAFYLDWFMERIRLGYFDIKNPYTHTIRKVKVLSGAGSMDSFHTIVFWSKNYEYFLCSGAGQKLLTHGFNLYFNFTINSESPFLEPNIPPLKHRITQLQQLASEFGPDNITWRFDPVCFFKPDENTEEKNNLFDFPFIAENAAQIGIRKCVTSFVDIYPKIRKRLKLLFFKTGKALSFVEPNMESKIKIVKNMEKRLKSLGIELCLCCEKDLFSYIKNDTMIRENACIDGKYLKKQFKGNPEIKRDYGQRSAQGCKCTKSVDIGSYTEHPCFHNCLFCYAEPAIDRKKYIGVRS